MKEGNLISIFEKIYISSFHGIAMAIVYTMLSAILGYFYLLYKSIRISAVVSAQQLKQKIIENSLINVSRLPKILTNILDFFFIFFYGITSVFLFYIVCDGILRIYPVIISAFVCFLCFGVLKKIKSFFPKKIKLWLIGLDFWIIYYSLRPICSLYSEIKKIIIKIIEKIHSLKRKRKNVTRKECSKKYCGSLYVFCRNGDKNTFIRKIIE